MLLCKKYQRPFPIGYSKIYKITKLPPTGGSFRPCKQSRKWTYADGGGGAIRKTR